MSPARKQAIVILTAWWGFAIGIVVLLVASGVLLHFHPEFGDTRLSDILTNPWAEALSGLSLLAGEAFNFLGLVREIEASNRRLADPGYVSRLRSLGFA